MKNARQSSLLQLKIAAAGALLLVLPLLNGCAGITGAASANNSSAQMFNVSGKITPVSGGAGATVALAGPASASATADSTGSFTFSSMPNGTYTVQMTHAGYAFTPKTMSVTVSGADVNGLTATASAMPATFAISGAAGMAGATITLSGTAAATTVADASGNYSITGLANGSYTVTPSKSGAAFTPASQPVSVNGANASAAAFSASTQTFGVSGAISGSTSGTTTITLSGTAAATTTANGSGNYSFSGLANGSYTVTPSKTGQTFAPASQTVTVNGGNVTVPSFGQSVQTFAVSGTATPAASATGAVVTLSGSASVVTTVNGAGSYSFTGLANGSYTVALSKSGFTFAPATQTIAVNGGNVTVSAFTATAQPQSFTISGTATPAANASGASVTLSGAASATTTVSGAGSYSFAGLANGSYTVALSKSGFTFAPATQTITVNGGNVTAGSVIAAAAPIQTFTLSGTATSAANASGATVTLSGAASATTTVSGAGSYSFAGLANGSYTVALSKSGFTFAPATQTVTISGGNATAGAFTATAQTFTISGTATPAASGSGATMTLSGASSATTTVSGSGTYSFTGLGSGSYVVTPGKSGFSFSPGVQAVTISGASSTAVDFTASAVAATFTISGTITPGSAGSGATVKLSGASSATTTANSSGSFTFAGLSNGTYTVALSSSNATFSPSSQNVTVNGANPAGLSFAATASSNVIFYDDFTEASLSSDWWALNVAANVNSQQECYTPNLVSLTGGFLQIQTVAQTTTCGSSTKSYGSGATVWSSFSFTYGTVEFRAKMPGGTGPWPAIWMLGVNCRGNNASQYNGSGCNWPNAGSEEIDITEILNSNHTSINQQIHVASGSPGCSATASDVSQNFHVYDLIWSQGKLVWQIDGNTTCTVTQGVPADAMFMIINTSVGGCCGGTPVNANFPQAMEVDYIKVTQP